MEILELQHDGPLPGQRAQPRCKGFMQLAAKGLGLEGRDVVVCSQRRQAEQPSEIGHHVRDEVQCGGEPLSGLVGTFVAADLRDLPEEVGERPVRESGAVRKASGVQPANAGRLAACTDGRRQARLPDSRFTGDRDNAPLPLRERLKGVCDDRELGLAADELGRCRPRCAALADESPGMDGLALAFQRQLADGFEIEAALCEAVRCVRDVGRTGRCHRLEPLREDDRVAEDAVVHPRLAPVDPRDPVP